MNLRSTRSLMPPLSTLVALAALVVGLAGATTTLETGVAEASPVVRLPPRPARAALLDLPAHPRVLLIGDSYTEGVGALPKTEGYSYHVAEPLGWQLTRDGIGGTGYLNRGPQQRGTFAERVWRHPADAYDLVVLQGGSNDEHLDPDAFTPAVDATVRAVRLRYPSAQLLVLGPTSPYGSLTLDRARVNRELERYTRSSPLLYLDPTREHWFVKGDGPVMANPDDFHPSNAGHARIAERFVQDVRALSLVRSDA